MKKNIFKKSYPTYNGNKAFASLQENGSLKISVEGFGDGKYKNDGFVISKDSVTDICSHLKEHPQDNPMAATHANQKAYSLDEKREEYGMKAYAPWTKEEEAVLRQLFTSGMTTEEIARRLMRGAGAIQSRLSKLGLS